MAPPSEESSQNKTIFSADERLAVHKAASLVASLRIEGGESRECRAPRLLGTGHGYDHDEYTFAVTATRSSPSEQVVVGEIKGVRYSKMEALRDTIQKSAAWKTLESPNPPSKPQQTADHPAPQTQSIGAG